MGRMLFLVLGLMLSWSLTAQTTFEKVFPPYFPSSSESLGAVIVQTPDQGYAVIAQENDGTIRKLLIQFSVTGSLVKVNDYLSSISDVKVASDERLVLAGQKDNSMLVMKTNQDGFPLWATTGGEGYEPSATSVCLTADGSICTAGTADRSMYSDSKIVALRTTADGTILWSRIFGTAGKRYSGNSVLESPDGGIVILGTVKTGMTGPEDIFMLKLSATGDSMWTKIYDRSQYDIGRFILSAGTSGFLAVGHSWIPDGNNRFFLVRTDLQGDTLWTREFGLLSPGDVLGATAVADGGYLLAGVNAKDSLDESKIILYRIDDQGTLLWSKKVGSYQSEYVFSVTGINDHGFALSGSIWDNNTQTMKLYLLKTDSLGNYVPSAQPEMTLNDAVQVFPNPATDAVQVFLPENTLRAELVSLQGECMAVAEPADPTGRTVIFRISDFASGIYLIRITTTTTVVSRKIVKL
ncbi:MAG: T9SS type A sorting domain-containing protein [Alphaproteobacteria bacterium]|nr:T9SS type A sorting domain-containing protein [Alphaproteobacteria bacterium]